MRLKNRAYAKNLKINTGTVSIVSRELVAKVKSKLDYTRRARVAPKRLFVFGTLELDP